MSIAALYNIPTDEIRLAQFSFHNRDQHELAADEIFARTGLKIPLYPIDPIKIEDFSNWLYTHQSMHNSVNTALSLPGNDLTDVDPNEPAQMATWVELHAREHRAWGDALGIG